MLAVWYGIGCFLILSLVILTSIGVVLHRHERECLYDITMPCYTDWQCNSEDGKSTYFTINNQFKKFYNSCLLNFNGQCKPDTAQLGLNNDGCNRTRDYSPSFNSAATQSTPYSGSSAYPTPYPLVGTSRQNTDNRNICAEVPGLAKPA